MKKTKRQVDFFSFLTGKLDELAAENARTGKHEKQNFNKTVREMVRLGFEYKAILEEKENDNGRVD